MQYPAGGYYQYPVQPAPQYQYAVVPEPGDAQPQYDDDDIEDQGMVAKKRGRGRLMLGQFRCRYV